MQQSIDQLIGYRIRIFRKAAGYSLVTFARELHRGKSVVSKYERGEISIDISTLKQIADVLGVSLHMLLADVEDFSSQDLLGKPSRLEDSSYETLYMYLYAAHRGKPLLSRNVIHLTEDTAYIYAELEDEYHIEKYKSFYIGTVQRETSFVRGLLSNPVVEHDLAFFEFQPPLKKAAWFTGFFCSLSIGQYFPIATKALFSRAPILDSAWLTEKLTISVQESRSHRAQNGFFVETQAAKMP